jgi:uncharacterized protein YuzE
MKTSHDKTTDSLCVEVRPLPSARTLEIEEDIMLDIGSDGEPVGYDIQHASTKTEFFVHAILGRAPRRQLSDAGLRCKGVASARVPPK